MSEEYLRRLRICFLELNRHNAFSTDRNLAYQEYVEVTKSTGKISAALLVSGWAMLFIVHKYIVAVNLRSYRLSHPMFTVFLGVGLSVYTHITLYNRNLISPLNRLSLMYEDEARDICQDLRKYPRYEETLREMEIERKKGEEGSK